jgi:integral membrane protein
VQAPAQGKGPRPGTFDAMSTNEAPVSSPPATKPNRSKLLTAYKVMSYVTGVGLIVLVFIAVPIKYIPALGEKEGPVAVVGALHGYLYMIYVVLALVLGYTRKWKLLKVVLVAAAGTIPLAVFFAERRVIRDEAARTEPVRATAA